MAPTRVAVAETARVVVAPASSYGLLATTRRVRARVSAARSPCGRRFRRARLVLFKNKKEKKNLCQHDRLNNVYEFGHFSGTRTVRDHLWIS